MPGPRYPISLNAGRVTLPYIAAELGVPIWRAHKLLARFRTVLVTGHDPVTHTYDGEVVERLKRLLKQPTDILVDPATDWLAKWQGEK